MIKKMIFPNRYSSRSCLCLLSLLVLLAFAQANAVPLMEVYADSTLAGVPGYLIRHGDTDSGMNTYFVFEEVNQVRFSHVRLAGADYWMAYPPGVYLTPPIQAARGYSWTYVPDTNGTKTATLEIFVERDVPAGRFMTASCGIRFDADPTYIYEYMSLAADVGIVRMATLPYNREAVLRSYSIVGGSGYLPLAVGNFWEYEIVAMSGVLEPQKASVSLLSCFPNPFNPHTTIAFELPRRMDVRLRVFDLKGRLVRELIGGESYTEGRHEVVWKGRDEAGRVASSGTYFYRLDAGSYSETKRMVLIK